VENIWPAAGGFDTVASQPAQPPGERDLLNHRARFKPNESDLLSAE
jgi:hypothetical protein